MKSGLNRLFSLVKKVPSISKGDFASKLDMIAGRGPNIYLFHDSEYQSIDREIDSIYRRIESLDESEIDYEMISLEKSMTGVRPGCVISSVT